MYLPELLSSLGTMRALAALHSGARTESREDVVNGEPIASERNWSDGTLSTLRASATMLSNEISYYDVLRLTHRPGSE